MRVDELSPSHLVNAKRELVKLLKKLKTPENRAEFRRRVVDGEISFAYSVNDYDDEKLCGCVGGTYVILTHGMTSPNDMYVVDTIERELPGFRGSDLESLAFGIGRGSTPGNNINSAWLLENIDAYLAEIARKEES